MPSYGAFVPEEDGDEEDDFFKEFKLDDLDAPTVTTSEKNGDTAAKTAGARENQSCLPSFNSEWETSDLTEITSAIHNKGPENVAVAAGDGGRVETAQAGELGVDVTPEQKAKVEESVMAADALSEPQDKEEEMSSAEFNKEEERDAETRPETAEQTSLADTARDRPAEGPLPTETLPPIPETHELTASQDDLDCAALQSQEGLKKPETPATEVPGSSDNTAVSEEIGPTERVTLLRPAHQAQAAPSETAEQELETREAADAGRSSKDMQQLSSKIASVLKPRAKQTGSVSRTEPPRFLKRSHGASSTSWAHPPLKNERQRFAKTGKVAEEQQVPLFPARPVSKTKASKRAQPTKEKGAQQDPNAASATWRAESCLFKSARSGLRTSCEAKGHQTSRPSTPDTAQRSHRSKSPFVPISPRSRDRNSRPKATELEAAPVLDPPIQTSAPCPVVEPVNAQRISPPESTAPLVMPRGSDVPVPQIHAPATDAQMAVFEDEGRVGSCIEVETEDFSSVTQQLELAVMEARLLRGQILETRVRLAIQSNKLLRLHNPIVLQKLSDLQSRAKAAMDAAKPTL